MNHGFEIERLFGLIFFVLGVAGFLFRSSVTSFFNTVGPKLSPTGKRPDLKTGDVGLLAIIELVIGLLILAIMNADIWLPLLK